MSGKKKNKYTSDTPRLFMEMCKSGCTLTQIASSLGVTKDELFKWSQDDKRRRDFKNIWPLGKQACQAYHETLLNNMIHGIDKKYSSAEIEAQKYRLRVQFKEDWAEKQEAKLEISNLDRLSDQELLDEIKRKVQANPGTRNFLQELLSNVGTPQFKIIKNGTDNSE